MDFSEIKPTKSELRLRTIWGFQIWGVWLFMLLLLFGVALFTADETFKYSGLLGSEKQVTGLFVDVLLGGFVSTLISYLCAYKGRGFWWLRFMTYFYFYYLVKGLLATASAFIACFSLIRDPIITSGQIGALSLSLLFLVLMDLLGIWLIYSSFRLIAINKKFRCQELMTPEIVEDWNSFRNLEDSTERTTLYKKLIDKLPSLSWFLKRVWKRKEVLITRW